MRISSGIGISAIALPDLNRLSSGKRIERAKDDPAGLAVLLELTSRGGRQGVALRNMGDALSISQIANGALSTISDISGRLAELSAQSANGTLSDGQRSALNQEYQALRQEIDRTVATTQFNGKAIFSAEGLSIQVGENGGAGGTIQFTLGTLSSDQLGFSQDIATQSSAQQALSNAGAAQVSLSKVSDTVGATSTQLSYAVESIRSSREGVLGAASRLGDADIAAELSRTSAESIRAQGGVALAAQGNLSSAAALGLLY
jgi:flagellin